MTGTHENSFIKPLSVGPPKAKDLEQSKHLAGVIVKQTLQGLHPAIFHPIIAAIWYFLLAEAQINVPASAKNEDLTDSAPGARPQE